MIQVVAAFVLGFVGTAGLLGFAIFVTEEFGWSAGEAYTRRGVERFVLSVVNPRRPAGRRQS